MPAFPEDCKDLISKILVLDPASRLTISEMKNHPCFRKNIPFEYTMPRPLPLPSFKDPIDPSTVPPEIIDVLRKIGYYDEQELAADFATDQHTMAKVFYFMMTSRVALDQLDWSQSVSMGEEPDINDEIMLNPTNSAYTVFNNDPFNRHRSTNTSHSNVEISTSLAFRPEWAMAPTEPMEVMQAYELMAGMDVTNTMLAVQLLIRRLEMQWFHPDDFMVIARQESLGLYLVLQVSQVDQSENPSTKLQIQLCHGTAESFNVVCRGAEEMISLLQQSNT
ncbi:putative CAMK family protein kinase [Tritrichomonas foetus]|uniref:CAMK family protein kinase n=1 Tax=Tritrichomonas foetus TaxID=1144522 RepID=A0A1J4J7E1_9EUKA|nr:putative CAMK family protein kinase [Tritrichomonas foetus]|eukprot:OHS95142.1 putative CAMK family protein kinase [Tritrichomonas foetus]